ncbi:MaoC family dehydratase [Umezawaea sp. NPDC059074]|uniref:MaoC family dehydratase n=1 Tax=Umezawaea sp. NPDC059074 TaxID=3346716 RepID=UPI003676DE91
MELAQGPFFEELALGAVFDTAPSVTVTTGHAATHQAIVGDRLRLPLDEGLARAVTGGAPLVHPALVWDLAIGQSTLVTHHVRANLFYRDLVFHRFPLIGDTLSTTTEVVGLRQNRPKPGRRPTGLAVLRIRTVDQDSRPVLDFRRCAMIPLGDPDVDTGHHEPLDEGTASTVGTGAAVASWRLDVFRDRVRGEHFADLHPGRVVRVVGADVVGSAPELARLTLNTAAVHHDAAAAGGRRLVYGGHTVGIAFAQVCRALPTLVTVVAWDGCDHLAPVHEGDSLTSTVTVESTESLPAGGGLAWLLVETESESGPVQRWRCAAVFA